jgi:hypothetical protein
MRTPLPAHPFTFNKVDQRRLRKDDLKAAKLRNQAKERYNLGASELPKLKIGGVGRVQHATQKRWDLLGEVVEIDKRGCSYYICTETGILYWRNRRYLRPFIAPEHAGKVGEAKKIEKKEDSDSSAKKEPEEEARVKMLSHASLLGACGIMMLIQRYECHPVIVVVYF